MIDTIFHVYNRGTEKRTIFLDDRDRLRFIASLIVFNSQDPTDPNIYRQLMEVSLPSVGSDLDQQFVELMAFCLMPNHYHLMLRPRIENGLTEFMRKLGTGYTNYFNLKYDRVGALFQGKFKSKPILTDAHFLWLPHYIHCNPFDGSLTSITEYPWSSYANYADRPQHTDIVDTSFLKEFLVMK